MQQFYKNTRDKFSPKKSPLSRSEAASGLLSQTTATHAHLSPKFSIPPVLHPTPYRKIGVAATPDGLLLFPDGEGVLKVTKYVQLRWGSTVHVKEVELAEDSSTELVAEARISGIIGILDIFQCPYLFVVTVAADVGNLYKDSHSVHCVRGVAAIPLGDETLGAAAVKAIAARVKKVPPPLISTRQNSEDLITPAIEIIDPQETTPTSASPGSTHVKFASEPVKDDASITSTASNSTLMLPPDPAFDSHSATSGQTTPASRSGSPVSNVILEKLSFWKRKKPPAGTTDGANEDDMGPLSASGDSSYEEGDEVQTRNEALDNLLSEATSPVTAEGKRTQLEAKIVRDVIREFSRGIFFYSYDFDITRSLQHKYELLQSRGRNDALLSDLGATGDPVESGKDDVLDASPLAEPQSNLPLWRRVDRKFWWNEYMSRTFMDAGLHSYVLPVMQGYFQTAAFHLPSPDTSTPPASDAHTTALDPNDLITIRYTIISRRSKERAGLRYQRRGIDDSADVANFVETETVAQLKRQGTWNLFSHVQIRGSIPLFWSQPGVNLKPAPKLDKPREESMNVFKQHFDRVIGSYGRVTAVNVAELTGKEAAVTTPYREAFETMANPKTAFHEFDFHRECAGMRYENILKLVSKLERTFESQGFFWVSGPLVLSKQHGVFRVNCIDCLDRTNVVMSAFSRHVLTSQVEALALLPANDAKHSEMELVFNDVWANNGDAISRAYAGTSALKGDFTRTGRRDLNGMLHDGMNSVMRMYSSTFSDYFSQACIDFFLGNRNLAVFSEFMLKLQSTDPKEMIRLGKIRAAAIETSVEMVLYQGETLVQGWTLLSPLEMNVRAGGQFVEKVLLLSAEALYVVNFDYSMVKVKMYTRIPLSDITGIKKGPYILSALHEASRSVADNYGFVVNFRPRQNATRITSYALRNQPSAYPTLGADASESNLETSLPSSTSGPAKTSSILSNVLSAASMGSNDHLFVAFKAIPDEVERETRGKDGAEEFVAASSSTETCQQAVGSIVTAIRSACVVTGYGADDGFIVEEDIVSLAEAQRLASVYSKFEYGFKRLLWLGVP